MKALKFLLITLMLTNSGCEQLDALSHESSKKRTISRIKSAYRGIIIAKYSPREMPPTHIKVKTSENGTINICPNQLIVDYVEIGDSIFKIKDENKVIIKRNTTKRDSFFYIKIPRAVRSDKDFPKEWRNKWMEATIQTQDTL